MEELVLTRDAVRELDRRAIEEVGVPSLLLMENAGRACADAALGMLEGSPDSAPVPILCGPGNNGGDGLVVARTLSNRGVPVRAIHVGRAADLENARGDVGENLRLWRALGRDVEAIEEERDVERVLAGLGQAPLVVDALFGTGLTRNLRDPWAAVVEAVNAAGRPVLAVDVPSGLDADTGEVLGAAVRASVTVTFVAVKPGFTLARGPELCGRVVVAEIGIPRFLLEEAR